MNNEAWSWYLWGAVKLVFLAVPAAWILSYWRKRGVSNRAVFYASCSNIFCYVLWVALILIMLGMQKDAVLRPMIPFILPAIIFVFIPLFLSIASVPLCISAFAAAEGEKRFAAVANGLMLVLWVSSVVAPN
jgi:hypothetical protein